MIGRKVGDIIAYLGLPPVGGLVGEVLKVVSVQTIWVALIAVVAAVVLARTPFGHMVYATGGNRRAASYAGINTDRVRFQALMFSASCAAMAGCINIAYFRSFNPVAGQFREIDAIAAVIIGGRSIFGGFGTIIGALAGAAVITLIRALMQLNIVTASGVTYSLPQHWVNAFVGGILIIAVLIDIWVRQGGLIDRLRRRRKPAAGRKANV